MLFSSNDLCLFSMKENRDVLKAEPWITVYRCLRKKCQKSAEMDSQTWGMPSAPPQLWNRESCQLWTPQSERLWRLGANMKKLRGDTCFLQDFVWFDWHFCPLVAILISHKVQVYRKNHFKDTTLMSSKMCRTLHIPLQMPMHETSPCYYGGFPVQITWHATV